MGWIILYAGGRFRWTTTGIVMLVMGYGPMNLGTNFLQMEWRGKSLFISWNQFSFKDPETVIYAFVSSHIDYCNYILFSYKEERENYFQCSKLQRLTVAPSNQQNSFKYLEIKYGPLSETMSIGRLWMWKTWLMTATAVSLQGSQNFKIAGSRKKKKKKKKNQLLIKTIFKITNIKNGI